MSQTFDKNREIISNNFIEKVSKGYFLLLQSLIELPKFIEFFNSQSGTIYDTSQKSNELIQSLNYNMNQCFPGFDFLNTDFIKNEQYENSNYTKKIYAFLLSDDLQLISSLTIHLFSNSFIGQSNKYYIKIYNVCVAQNQSGTKILMNHVLTKIKPIAETIWLDVVVTNEKAYNLYLDLGFEFVFSNKSNTFGMIYNKNNPIISSRDNLVLQKQRRDIITDMRNYKIYNNYINKIGDLLVPAIISPNFYNFEEEKKEEEKKEEEKKEEEKKEEEKKEDIIKKFIFNIYYFLNPTIKKYTDEMNIEGYRKTQKTRQPLLIFKKNKKSIYLFINSLVNNTDKFNNEISFNYYNKLYNLLHNCSNIDLNDIKILLKTQFPIESLVKIRDEISGTYVEQKLKLNLFSVIFEDEIKTYSYKYIEYPINGDIYNININRSESIKEIDLYVKYALSKGVKKICVKINNSIPINLIELYFTFNLLPSYSACPYKENIFVYNYKRFNNINNTYWELDSFNFNNLYVEPTKNINQQPISKEVLEKISGCGISNTMEEYYTEYLNYLNFSTYKNKFKVFLPNGDSIFFSFLGYIISQCNETLLTDILKYFGITENNQTDFYKIIQTIPFMTLNYFDSNIIKPGLINNINILSYTRIVNFMSSNSHGSMVFNDIKSLKKGQKLIMFTKPNTLFYMNNINYNFISLIFDYNNIQRLFDCIDLLNNDNIHLSTYFEQYRDIISILMCNNSIPDNDVIIYTDKYNEHILEYNQEIVSWVNFPFPSHQHYMGNFIKISPNKILLNPSLIDRNKINTIFSLHGLFVNFNSDNNNIDNTVTYFEISDDLTTYTVTLSSNVPLDATDVIIGNLHYQYRTPSIDEFYRKILRNFNCSIDYVLDFLIKEDNRMLLIQPNYSNNFNTNKETYINFSAIITNLLLSSVEFMDNSLMDNLSIKMLAEYIVYNKLLLLKNDVNTVPLSIRTNENIDITDFSKSNTPNIYIKEYSTQNKQIYLSYLLDKGLKHNSFICCRGVENYQGVINVVPLPGEIRLRDLLTKKLIHTLF